MRPHTPEATYRGAMAVRSGGTSPHMLAATTSGGINAGITIGQKNGGAAGRVSRSSAIIAANPDAGTSSSAAIPAARGIAPFLAPISATTASMIQSTISASAVNP